MDGSNGEDVLLTLNVELEQTEEAIQTEIQGDDPPLDRLTALIAARRELRQLRQFHSDRAYARELDSYDSDNFSEEDDSETDWEDSGTETHSDIALPEPTLDCSVCFQTTAISGIVTVPCQELYCNDCVRQLFQISFRDESLFPPRCCTQVIPLEMVEHVLDDAEIRTYREKEREFGTSDRTYCSYPHCSAFIDPTTIHSDVAWCSKCGNTTCAICKAAAHEADCPEDESLKEVLALAAEQNWQRCPRCRTMVELKFGCNHMTCVCSHEFCYLCALKWKACGCAQWQERQLLNHAERLVDRDAAVHNRGGANRQAAVAAAAQMLVDRHECQHLNWRSLSGVHDCEICGHEMPIFIKECQQCRILMCRRCVRNRMR